MPIEERRATRETHRLAPVTPKCRFCATPWVYFSGRDLSHIGGYARGPDFWVLA
jgi:hypothetical protein